MMVKGVASYKGSRMCQVWSHHKRAWEAARHKPQHASHRLKPMERHMHESNNAPSDRTRPGWRSPHTLEWVISAGQDWGPTHCLRDCGLGNHGGTARQEGATMLMKLADCRTEAHMQPSPGVHRPYVHRGVYRCPSFRKV